MAFARNGDSGAMIIDNDGRIIGMIMALVEIKVIVHPTTTVPGILEITKQRQLDGSIDMN